MTSALPLAPRAYGQQLLDALPDATAIVDSCGVITAVNPAWKMFAVDNACVLATTDVGMDYLRVCDQAAAAGVTDAATVAADLRVVLAGDSVQREVEYQCSSPLIERWFVLRMTPIGDPISGVLISHFNITARRAAEQDLRHNALHDALTGLANRALLLERLSHALTPRPGRAAEPDVGLLLLDLDQFKDINDTYGHAAGDAVLVAIARRLRRAVRSEDLVARLGGDEFVVLAPRTTRETLAVMARHIAQTLAPWHLIDGTFLPIDASIGTHLAAAGSNPVDLLGVADAAMYADKHARARRTERAAATAGRVGPGHVEGT